MCRGLRALSGGVMRIAVVDKAVKIHPVGVLEHTRRLHDGLEPLKGLDGLPARAKPSQI